MSEETKDELIKEVFRAFESDIKKTVTQQCQYHSWRKLNDHELACMKCPTVIIVDNINDYV